MRWPGALITSQRYQLKPPCHSVITMQEAREAAEAARLAATVQLQLEGSGNEGLGCWAFKGFTAALHSRLCVTCFLVPDCRSGFCSHRQATRHTSHSLLFFHHTPQSHQWSHIHTSVPPVVTHLTPFRHTLMSHFLLVSHRGRPRHGGGVRGRRGS